ncbi:MAG: hypothetical protein RL670_1163 [Actinomycetota bacterium]|jgi:two-component sensor histidine kinase
MVSDSSRFEAKTIERLLARIYSVAVAASTIEALVNAWSQRDHLQPIAWLYATMLAIVVLGMLAGAFINDDARLWYRVHALTGLVLISNWQFQLLGDWTAGTKPWIWWVVGATSLSAGFGFRNWRGWSLQLLIPALWVLVTTSPSGGANSLGHALEDAGYVFFLAISLTAVITALRSRARLVDSDNLKALTSLAEQNLAVAFEHERTSAVSVVHTQVLTAIQEASEAKTKGERAIAAATAKDALNAINDRLHYTDLDGASTPLDLLVRTLEQTLKSRYPKLQLKFEHLEGVSLPNDVALALTESTLQAVDNATRHAGTGGVAKLSIEGLHSGVRIVISDKGRGFRESRDSRGLVGIRQSIRERSTSVGAKVSIQTAPNQGCRVTLKWVKP